jgi:hypothetical protein
MFNPTGIYVQKKFKTLSIAQITIKIIAKLKKFSSPKNRFDIILFTYQIFTFFLNASFKVSPTNV